MTQDIASAEKAPLARGGSDALLASLTWVVR